MRTRRPDRQRSGPLKSLSICSTCFEFLLSDFATNCWSGPAANPYRVISSGGSAAGKPVDFEQFAQFAAAAIKQHPQVVWGDVQDLADLVRAEAVEFPQ